jgi:chromate transport protein ChrA
VWEEVLGTIVGSVVVVGPPLVTVLLCAMMARRRGASRLRWAVTGILALLVAGFAIQVTINILSDLLGNPEAAIFGLFLTPIASPIVAILFVRSRLGAASDERESPTSSSAGNL